MPNVPSRKLRSLPPDQLMSQKAAARELGIGRATVTAWIAAERLEAGRDPYGVVKPTRDGVARLKEQLSAASSAA